MKRQHPPWPCILYASLVLNLLSPGPLQAAETQTGANDKPFIDQADTVTTHANTLTNAASEVGSQVEQFKKGRNQDTTAIEGKNAQAGKINAVVSNVAGGVTDIKTLSDASKSAAHNVTTFEEANEDIKRARQFWDDLETKQRTLKKEIEAAGGYYRYLDINSQGLSLEEQREMKRKLEKFVSMKRPQLNDASMLSTENIDLRGTISVLASKTSGNAQIIFKSLENSIKAVDELAGLRAELKSRDQNAAQMQVTIAKARAKQQALQHKVATEFEGNWERYVASLYPDKSSQEQSNIAKRIQAAATKEIKSTDTDVGVWESIDLGGSLNALADNISMVGSKSADAAAEVYKHGKNIYQGAKDGVGLVGDYADLENAESTQKRTAFALQTKKNAQGWDKDTLIQATKHSLRMIDDIQNGRANGDIVQWQTRLALYKEKLASFDATKEQQLRKEIPEYAQLRAGQEAAQALQQKMKAAQGKEAQSINQQFQEALEAHYKRVEQVKAEANQRYAQLVKELSVRMEQAFPDLRPGLAATTFVQYQAALDILYRKQVELQALHQNYQESRARAQKDVQQAEKELAEIPKRCAEKLEQAKQEIAKAEAWEHKNAQDLESIAHMKRELARINAEVARGDHRWHPMGYSYNEYLESFVQPAKKHLATMQEQYQHGRWLNQAGILAEIKYRKKEIEEAKQVLNVEDPRFHAELKKLDQLRVIRLEDYFI